MAKVGNTRHTKRYNTPKYFRMTRKHPKFFINTSPGPHPKRFSFPLGFIIRDMLGLAHNMREVKYILNNGKVLVDGKIRKSYKFPVGLMDVVEIPEINKRYRVLPSGKYTLTLSEITEEEAKFKLCKIVNITTLKGGHLQLNLHDGRNIIIKVDDPTRKPDVEYKTNGTLKISVPDQKILDYYPYEVGNEALVYKGANIGHSGKLSKVIKRYGVRASIAEIGDVSTAYEYIFIIGKESPVIDLPIE